MMNKALLGASLAFTLLVAACSQAPAEVTGGLEPQFGTSGSDWGSAVATDPAHPYIYAAGDFNDAQRVFLRRYNRDGSLAWQRLSPTFAGITYTQDADTDAAGNAVIVYAGDTNPDPFEELYNRFLIKYDRNGKELWRKALSPNSEGKLALDRRGNIYVASAEAGSLVEKYAPDGRLLWNTTWMPEFGISDLAVSDAGELYTVGTDLTNYDLNTGQGYIRVALRKYDAEGKLAFDRSVSRRYQGQYLALAQGNVYVAFGPEGAPVDPLYLNKYDRTGKLLLERTLPLSDDEYRGLRGMSADEAGNVYLTGYISRENPDSTDPFDSYEADTFVSKYTSALRPVWTYSPESRGSFEYGSGVDARTSGEVYTLGRTTAKVNGVNKGYFDVYLKRLDGQGKKVWER